MANIPYLYRLWICNPSHRSKSDGKFCISLQMGPKKIIRETA